MNLALWIIAPSTVTNLTTIMVAEHIYRRAHAR